MSRYRSWGRTVDASHQVIVPQWRSQQGLLAGDGALLPFGNGRSYGDCCLNDGGSLIDAARLNHFISFDQESGVLRCEGGVLLASILNTFAPLGWFLPVVPGTKLLSLGGAIANDVHGKNHHKAGTFGRHVLRFELLRSNGERLLCSAEENPDYFKATIAGLGLTGFILWVDIQLKEISSPFIDSETVQFGHVSEYFDICSSSDENFEYTVAWLDVSAKGASLGRGLYMRGNHLKSSTPKKPKQTTPPKRDKLKTAKLSIPFDMPGFLLNKHSIRAFNCLYYNKQRTRISKKIVHYDPFFFPLDVINNWNRLYGKRGFFQYQFSVPHRDSKAVVEEVLKMLLKAGHASFLTTMKTFGDLESPGLMSFPKPGVTLALDLANGGTRSLKLFNKLDEFVLSHSGSFYPAKDARMSPESFHKAFPQFEEFSKYIDPKFSSNFLRRVTGKDQSL